MSNLSAGIAAVDMAILSVMTGSCIQHLTTARMLVSIYLPTIRRIDQAPSKIRTLNPGDAFRSQYVARVYDLIIRY
jgi:hypothetical protein